MSDSTNDAARDRESRAGANEPLPAPIVDPQTEIRKFLELIVRPGTVFEVRALACADRPGGTFRSTASGYFQHAQIAKAAKDIAALDASGEPGGFYITLNTVQDSLLARAENRMKFKARATTGDEDVSRRCWLLIDCDPNRAADISSTAPELALSKAKAEQVRAYLVSLGWPEPLMLMSGNGYHLLLSIDLSVDDGGLIERVLRALADRFDDGVIKIDRSVHNPARITKIAGTMARKGDHMVGVEGIEDRPHRRAYIVSAPDKLMPVSLAQLEALAPPPPAPLPASRGPAESTGHRDQFDRFDHTPAGVTAYLARHGLPVKGEKRDGTATLLFLERCPVVPECQSGNNSDIAVIVGDDGVIAYKNWHDRGAGLQWVDVREALEPGYKAFAAGHRALAVDESAAWVPPLPLHARACPFPIADAFPPGTELVRDFVQGLAVAYQVPVDLPSMVVLPAVGLALSQRVVIRLGADWTQHPNHYTGTLMEPANRKTAPYREVIDPIVEWELRQAEEMAPVIAKHNARIDMMKRRLERLKDLASGKAAPRRGSDEPSGAQAEEAALELEADLADQKPMSVPQLLAGDVTTEALARLLAGNGERQGAFSDESETIEVFLGRYSNQPNFQLYNKGYDGSFHRINRVVGPPILLQRPLVSVGFVIQPDGVIDMLTNRKAKGTGLVARFAWSMPRSTLGHREIRPTPLDRALRSAWKDLSRSLLEMPKPPDGKPIEVQLSAGAQKMFDDFCRWIEPALAWCGEFAAHGMQDWGGKLAGRVGRLALCLHGLRYAANPGAGLTEPVSAETMRAAIAWAPYFIDHAKCMAGWLGVDESILVAKRILAWIARERSAPFSKQQCFTCVRSVAVQQAEQVNAPLALLCDLGYLRRVPDPLERGRGRPASPEFIVNPTWDRETF